MTSPTTPNNDIPECPEAERALLGSMMLSPDAAAFAIDNLTSNDFWRPAHKHIFSAITRLFNSDEPIDPPTVIDVLRRDGLLDSAGGPSTLAALVADAPGARGAKRHVRTVSDYSRLRQMSTAANEIQSIARGLPADVSVALDECEQLISSIPRPITSQMADGKHLAADYEAYIKELQEGTSDLLVRTGFASLDAHLNGGLGNGRLYILAARPGMGKTSLAMNVAGYASMANRIPVYVASLEMSEVDLTARVVAAESRVPPAKVEIGDLGGHDKESLADTLDTLRESPLVIDYKPGATMGAIRDGARKVKARYGSLGLIVVDYLQLMTSPGAESHQLGVSQNSRQMKLMAQELDCPVILLSQLNRKVEERENKRPFLADLRDSGSLEQDADAVIFVYRDGYYNPDSETPTDAEIIIAKNRFGEQGTVILPWKGDISAFRESSLDPQRTPREDATFAENYALGEDDF